MSVLGSSPPRFPSLYVYFGLAIAPIPFGSKAPKTKEWNLAENVVTDARVAEGITGNFGLAHAYCEPSPTMALDIDDVLLAEQWLSERGMDLASMLTARDAVLICSGRPNRIKLLYRLHPGVSPMRTIQVKDPGTGEMILEFRCATAAGLTVQDVLPPSIHPDTGQPYQWGGLGHWSEIPIIPDTVLAVWQAIIDAEGAKKSARQHGQPSCTAVDDTPRKRATVGQMLEHISADCSYPVYRNIVWAILSLGWHDGEEMARHWCMTAPHRFDEGSFHSIVAGYNESMTPTFGTIHHHASKGGFDV